ncbi:MAG: hypothetical protein HOK52_10705 [Candidatus Marinimicrobia bacterium]|nr:hypothetical protein [Candidatus Neomarinimicrobiota bacterium]
MAQNKFYVGKTDKPKFRLDSHFKNGGCAWTKKYKPIQILGLFPDCDDFDEDKYTLKYMSKYGIDNVRGGSFCQTTLSRENINTIERMISSSNDCCHFCGEKGHFIGRCSNKKEKQKYSKQNKHFLQLSKDYESADEVEWDDGSDDDSSDDGVEEQSWACSYCNKSFDTKKGAQFHENVHCKERKQMKNDVLSSADEDLVTGVYEVDGEHLYWDGEEWYEESTNYAGHRDGTFGNQDGDWRPIKKQKKSTRKGDCHKCGRKGHYASKCYAKKHINGYYLN